MDGDKYVAIDVHKPSVVIGVRRREWKVHHRIDRADPSDDAVGIRQGLEWHSSSDVRRRNSLGLTI
jgi:hypothetical protein